MKSRREFLKGAATGACSWARRAKLGLARRRLTAHGRDAAGQSRVVIARDPALHGADGKLDESACWRCSIGRSVTYTGREEAGRGLEAALLPRSGAGQGHRAEDQRPGRKRHFDARGAGARGCRTPAAGRGEAGQHRGLGSQRARSCRRADSPSTPIPGRIRCYGSDVSGFEDQARSRGVRREIRLSKDSHPRMRDGHQRCRFSRITACRASPSR